MVKVHKYLSNSGLPVIKCECGFEILVVFDLKVMGQAIDRHGLEHKNQGATDAEVNIIELDLIAQVLSYAADESEV
jgi:hypothetical protein